MNAATARSQVLVPAVNGSRSRYAGECRGRRSALRPVGVKSTALSAALRPCCSAVLGVDDIFFFVLFVAQGACRPTKVGINDQPLCVTVRTHSADTYGCFAP